MSQQRSLHRLKCPVQNYDWGRRGSKSLVARLAPEASGPDFKLDENEAYAEVWMGTHPNGPAALYNDPGTSLQSLLSADPAHLLGSHIISKFPVTSQDERSSRRPEIPFLFKVLSIAKALPLQAHPDKALAEKLNARDGQSFVDANHKPEIALALGDFRGFVGFKPLEEIQRAVEETPELAEAIGRDVKLVEKPSLKVAVSALLHRSQNEIEPLVRRLVDRLKSESKKDYAVSQLVVEVDGQYPGDVGVFIAPFFMNLVTLCKGEAVYIGADEVHAYLEGDIIECMAVSDNVVNAAFVPPSGRDADTFTEMLTYTLCPPSQFALRAKPYKRGTKGRTTAYDPPLEEFTVLWTKLDDSTGGEEQLDATNGPTIGIVLEGEAHLKVGKEAEVLKTGAVVFVAAEKTIVVRADQRTEVFWATLVA